MDGSCFKARQGQRVVRAGALLLLLSVLLGFIIPRFTLPRLAVSAHLVGLLQGLLLLTTGQLWGRLRLSQSLSGAANALGIGGAYGAWASNVLAAAWGAGGELLRHAASGAKGTEVQELILSVLLRGSGLAIALSWVLIVFGLRPARARAGPRRSRPAPILPKPRSPGVRARSARPAGFRSRSSTPARHRRA
jgi:(hydroxyamino)benzene mutase